MSSSARLGDLVARMALREARLLLQRAPDELAEIELAVRPCGAHLGPSRGDVAEWLPPRWLGQRIGVAGAAVVLVAVGCEVLEPRALVGLANLIDGGWTGTVETRAATAARLHGQGRTWPAVVAGTDLAEARFESGGPGPVTLPASCRTAAGEHRFLSPHGAEDVVRWDGTYQRLRMRAVLEIGL